MNAYLTQLKEWLAGLAPRERTLVLVCAVCVAATILDLAIWRPLAHLHERREQALASAHALANRLEAMSLDAQRAQRNGAAGANRGMSLLSAVDQSSKSGTLSKPPKSLQPDGDNQVKVWLEGVAFESIVRWIAELDTRYGISTDTVDIDKDATPGQVNARITLVRQ